MLTHIGSLHIRPLSAWFGRFIILVTAMLLSGSVVYGEASSVHAIGEESGEIIIAHFTGGTNAVTTQQSYDGLITLRVSGIGQSAGTHYNDAFYTFTDSFGKATSPSHSDWFRLVINGQIAEVFIPGNQVPVYQPDHIYTFTIQSPGTKLTFGVKDLGIVDNTGEFIIEIQTANSCNAPFFSQRDELWRTHPLRTAGICGGECNTIGACGCTLTSAAMLFAYYGAAVTPATLSDCMGTSACPFYWSVGAACSDNKAQYVGQYPFDWSRLDQELNQNGRPVILGMHKSSNASATHWVLVTGGSGSEPGNYITHDPWPLSGQNTSLATLARNGWVFDTLSVYDGQPQCALPFVVSVGENQERIAASSAPTPAADLETSYMVDSGRTCRGAGVHHHRFANRRSSLRDDRHRKAFRYQFGRRGHKNGNLDGFLRFSGLATFR